LPPPFGFVLRDRIFFVASGSALATGDRGGNGSKGGRPAFDHVLMFQVLLLQAMHGLSDERAEYLIKDRLSFMRFLGLGLADAVPDANTIWTFREALKRANVVQALFARFDATLKAAGYLAMGGQIVDATIVAAPKQRNTEAERAAIKAGQVPEGWAGKPAKLRQKDRDARWTVKFSKAKPREDGAPQIDLAVPAFGYKNHIGIDRGHGLIRGWTPPITLRMAMTVLTMSAGTT
jgi:IS5 family transposase